MRKIIWLFALGLVGIIFFLEYDVTERLHQVHSRRLSANRSALATKGNIQVSSSAAPKNAVNSALNFEAKFAQVTQSVSQLQENPEEAENKMQTLAVELSALDIKKLSEIMKNAKSNGDQRAMAVELLSRHQSVESLKQLEDFVQQPLSNSAWNRNREFESVLRAQAIEGIAAYPQKDLALSSLMALDPKLDETFLKDRVKRSMAGLKNQAPSAEKQDDVALKKLIE